MGRRGEVKQKKKSVGGGGGEKNYVGGRNK